MKYLYTVTLSNRDYDDDDFVSHFISNVKYGFGGFNNLVQNLAERYITKDNYTWNDVIDNVLDNLKNMGFVPIELDGEVYKYQDDSVEDE